MIECYIFDLDDTIIDSSIYKRMYAEVLSQLQSHLKLSEIKLQEVISKVKKKTGKEKPDTYELCKELNATELYYFVLERYVKHTYTLKTKSIPSLFRKIKAKDKRIGIVSHAQERTVKMFLKRFHLFEHVNFIVSGNKDTILFWVTLERKHDLIKENTMVIDNSEEILEIAKHSGYKVLNVKNIEELENFDL